MYNHRKQYSCSLKTIEFKVSLMRNCNMCTNESWTRVNWWVWAGKCFICEIFTHNLAKGHLYSPKICAATLLLNFFDVLRIILQSYMWLPETKSNQSPEVPEDSHPYSKVGLSPHLTFLFQFLPLISFYFLARFQSLSLSPKAHNLRVKGVHEVM